MHEQLNHYPFAQNIDYSNFTLILLKTLTQFCQQLDQPLVILFDEVDCLTNGTLIAFLRQLRNGYVNRNRMSFVHSLALVGMRHIRDYKSRVRDDKETLGSYSPFNIVTESLTLRNFTLQEVTHLYAQHTALIGQMFSPHVIEKIYYYTQGQPWLVNALAREMIVKMLNNDFSKTIHPEQASRLG
jgi:hypothetical protein